MITVYISVGNSDDKLSQADWAAFVQAARILLRQRARQVHGEWYAAADAAYQNACFCVDLAEDDVPAARQALISLRKAWHQDSAAWAEVPVTLFI